jgi:hypothetical protein
MALALAGNGDVFVATGMVAVAKCETEIKYRLVTVAEVPITLAIHDV